MKNIMKLIKAEFYKSIKGKNLIIILLIVVCAIVFMSLIYGVSVEEYNKLFPEENQDYSPQEVVEVIEYNMAENEEKFSNGEIARRDYLVKDYQMRAELAIADYMIEHNLEYDDFDRYMEMSMMTKASAQNMIMFVLSSATLIIGIIAAVMAASALSDEINQGTMRMLLISPVKRISLIVAKMINIMISITLVLIAMVIVSFIMGFILYPNDMSSIMIIINAQHAMLISFGAAVLLQTFLLLVYAFIIASIILAMVSVFRSKIFGIIIGVILCTNLLTTALLYRPSLVKLFSLTVLTNMDFNVFFTATGNIYGQLSLPMAIIVYIINAIAMLGISFLVFAHRDID